MPTFDIHPAEPKREDYHTIIYLEPPNERNAVAIGYDMFTEPTRRAAMEKARDTGAAVTSGKVTLLQEVDANKQAGFLIYTPIYFFGGVPTTLELRRSMLAGFVYAPFRVDDLMAGILGSEAHRSRIAFSIYDGQTTDEASVLHRSDRDDAVTEPAQFKKTTTLQVPGRQWTLAYRSQPEFVTSSAQMLSGFVLAAGGIVSFLLFVLSLAQSRAQQRAESAASELRRSETALRASESKFRRLVDSNIMGVSFSTLDGKVVDGNDEYFRIVGRRRDEALAGHVRWDAVTAPGYQHVDRAAVAELKASGVCHPFEKEYVRPDGTHVPVLIGVAMLEGSTNETVAMVLDQTAQKLAERQIVAAKETAEAARADAEAASRLKDEFLATVSHELRSPLNAIFGWSQLLTTARNDPAELQHGLSTIQRAAKAQAQLIDDLLDVSRIVAGKLRLDVQVVSLASIIEAASASVRPAAEAKGVQLVHEFDATAGPVNGDPHRLQQIVWNLLSNAVKFTPRGGRINVELRRDDGNAAIVVHDTGIGIEPKFLPHIFERFRQADASTTRKYGGLGLGLAIVRHLVELHGGTVTADSTGDGQGATFTVLLPLAIAGASNNRGSDQTAEGTARSESGALTGVRVLFVEDDPDSREMVSRMLRQRGAEVACASSAGEGFSTFPATRPHVVISDIGMPGEDGYALLSRIRALPADQGGRVPAIALTALARPEDRRRALHAGYQLHLPKPIDATELATAVASLAAAGARTEVGA
jgi:PAS domain S-box-containing protein